MDGHTTRSDRDESYDEMLRPSTSPTFFQDLYDIIKSEPTTGLPEVWEGGHNLKREAKIQTTECQQNFGRSDSLDSSESEPWTPQYRKLLPEPSAYNDWPSLPTDNKNCPILCQLECASSPGYFPDCSTSFSAVAGLSMQTYDKPVSETPPSIDSPRYHHNSFREGSLAQFCLQADEIPGMDSLVNESTSQSDYFEIIQTPMSDYSCTSDLPKAQSDINSLPYSQLLYRAFINSDTRELSLHKIYQWFEENTNKAEDKKGKDWRSSIRHNLSMNQAFNKVLPPKKDGKESRRATGWELADWAVDKGVQSTSKYREVKTGSKPHRPRRKARGSCIGSRRAP